MRLYVFAYQFATAPQYISYNSSLQQTWYDYRISHHVPNNFWMTIVYNTKNTYIYIYIFQLKT